MAHNQELATVVCLTLKGVKNYKTILHLVHYVSHLNRTVWLMFQIKKSLSN